MSRTGCSEGGYVNQAEMPLIVPRNGGRRSWQSVAFIDANVSPATFPLVGMARPEGWHDYRGPMRDQSLTRTFTNRAGCDLLVRAKEPLAGSFPVTEATVRLRVTAMSEWACSAWSRASSTSFEQPSRLFARHHCGLNSGLLGSLSRLVCHRQVLPRGEARMSVVKRQQRTLSLSLHVYAMRHFYRSFRCSRIKRACRLPSLVSVYTVPCSISRLSAQPTSTNRMKLRWLSVWWIVLRPARSLRTMRVCLSSSSGLTTKNAGSC